MSVTVRVLDLGPLAKFLTKEDLRLAAEDLLKRQRARITAGIGSNGKPMKALKKGYAKEAGRTVRTLERTGAMLNSRAVIEVSDTSATIGFVGAPEHAYVHQAKTPFVKAAEREREALTSLVRKRVEARLKAGCAEVRRRRSF